MSNAPGAWRAIEVYRVRNGQRSNDYGQYPKSYHLQRP